ncbi:MAG: TlpA family protein disulfide reductase [Acidobacteriota bacterium]
MEPLTTISGQPIALRELFAGGPVVLVLWNSWLPDSAEFGPQIVSAAAAARAAEARCVVVVFQDEPEAARGLPDGDAPVLVALDRHGELLRRFKVTRAPAVLVVGADGAVRSRGGPGADEVAAALRSLEKP